MSVRPDYLIRNAITLEGHSTRVAYDPNGLTYGYFLCTACKKFWYAPDPPYHTSTCPVKGKSGPRSASWIIYVFTPGDNGISSPFTSEHLLEIKQLAQSKMG